MQNTPSFGAWLIALLGVAIVALPENARASENTKACITAHTEGQLLRGEGKLVEAKRRFVTCIADPCPPVVRKDCAEFLKEVESSTPSVVLTGLDAAGQDTLRVSVSIDGAHVAPELVPAAIPLDPGQHEFEFKSANGEVRRVTLVLREGEKRRQVIADFRAVPARIGAGEQTTMPRAGSPAPALAYVLGAVGVAALGSFAYFAITGNSIENELDECKPSCQGKEDRISSMRTRYLIGDISLGVAAVSLGVGTYLFFKPRPEVEPGAAARMKLRVGSDRTGNLSIAASGTF